MGFSPVRHFTVAAVLLTTAGTARAGDAGGRVNNLKVLSAGVDDVSTVEDVVASFCKPGMSDTERTRALWTAAVRYRHQAPPPNEFLAADWEAHDPVKIFNVYGYCMCCCSSAVVAALNRADGREARGRILNGHSVPEVQYAGGWHMLDASLITLFPRPDTGAIASVDEIGEAVRSWYGTHPGYRGDRSKLTEMMRRDGWTGWKQGPPMLASCPFYRGGFFPAGTHGWNDTMAEYARDPSEVYEYGYQVGHRALFSLRPGESLTREAGNRGLHVNMEADPDWPMLRSKAPAGDLKYVDEFLPGYRGGVVGNGVHRYAPDLAAGDLAAGAESIENVAAGDDSAPALHPAVVGRPGVVVVPMTSPYVYLTGRIRLRPVRRGADDRLVVSLSTNNGRTFTPVHDTPPGADGSAEVTIDVGRRVLRRYAYWVKLEMLATAPGSAGLRSIVLESDVQHAPRTLPRLRTGTNPVRVVCAGDPTQTTRTITCRITPDRAFARNESSTSMGLRFDNLDVRDGSCWWKSGTGVVAVPVATPGDLVGLRGSIQYRARDARDTIRLSVSHDAGATWLETARFTGPTAGTTRAFRVDGFHVGTREALLRLELTGRNTVGIFSLRVDADHRDPLAAPTFRPFRVVHQWTENARPREHVETIESLPASYTIETAAEPEMVSVRYEMPSVR